LNIITYAPLFQETIEQFPEYFCLKKEQSGYDVFFEALYNFDRIVEQIVSSLKLVNIKNFLSKHEANHLPDLLEPLDKFLTSNKIRYEKAGHSANHFYFEIPYNNIFQLIEPQYKIQPYTHFSFRLLVGKHLTDTWKVYPDGNSKIIMVIPIDISNIESNRTFISYFKHEMVHVHDIIRRKIPLDKIVINLDEPEPSDIEKIQTFFKQHTSITELNARIHEIAHTKQISDERQYNNMTLYYLLKSIESIYAIFQQYNLRIIHKGYQGSPLDQSIRTHLNNFILAIIKRMGREHLLGNRMQLDKTLYDRLLSLN
jgi:hypothetical protein